MPLSEYVTPRMSRIFRDDERSLVIAMDHGTGLNVYPDLSDISRVLGAVIEGGADALLLTPGIIKQFSGSFRSVGIIMRVDGGSTELKGDVSAHRLLYSVEDALRLGADAVACMGFPGSEWEAETLANIAALAGQCRNWGVPMMAEMIPGGFVNPSHHTPENVRLAARVGVELGADFIKTKFVEPAEKFREVVEHCYRPVLILGGGHVEDERTLFERVKTALDKGAAGVVMGRMIWRHPAPRLMVRALERLIHHDASVAEALHTFRAESGA